VGIRLAGDSLLEGGILVGEDILAVVDILLAAGEDTLLVVVGILLAVVDILLVAGEDTGEPAQGTVAGIVQGGHAPLQGDRTAVDCSFQGSQTF